MESKRGTVVWGSGSAPEACDVCEKPLAKEGVFYDALIPYRSWAILCDPCFKRLGCAVGTGRGQKFATNTCIKLEG
jgi:hypothetical protein